MPLVVLPKHPGFNPKGVRRHLWIPETAMPDGVLDTAAIDAATDVTNNLVTAPDYTPTEAQLADGDVGSRKVGKVAGDITYPDTMALFRLHPDGPASDIRAVLHEGDRGFWVVANEGLEAAKSADVISASIGYGGKTADEVARIQFPIIVNDVDQDVVIPALV